MRSIKDTTARPIRIAVGLAACTLLAFTAACSDHSQGHAERQTKPVAHPASSKSPDCSADSDLSQAEWTEKCADKAKDGGQPDTELNVGDAFAYHDGVKIRIDSIKKITHFGEYDEKPDTGVVPFRVTWTITNGTKKALPLDAWVVSPAGADTGGEVTFIYVEAGSKEMTGRIAPGKAGTYTGEYSIPTADGKSIVVTVTRMDDNADLLAEDPNWTGPIQ